MLSDYNAAFAPTSLSLYDYHKNGDTDNNLDEVRTYAIDGVSKGSWLTEDNTRLTSASEYAGKEGDEKIQRTYDYSYDSTTSTQTITDRKDYLYTDEALTSTKTYNTEAESMADAKILSGEDLETRGLLTDEQVYIGDAGVEKISRDYAYTYDETKQEYRISVRTDYNYGPDGALTTLSLIHI